MARPRTKSDTIALRLPVEVYEWIEAKAEAAGTSVGVWLEGWVVRSYEHTIEARRGQIDRAFPAQARADRGREQVTPLPKTAPKKNEKPG